MQNKKYIGLIIVFIILIIIIISLIILINNKENVKVEDDDKYDGGYNLELINELEDVEEISKYEYNEYKIQVIEDNNMANIYFNNYRYNALYHPEVAYELLDEEYRTKKFGNYETYKKYLDDNMQQIYMSTMSSFSVYDGEDGKYDFIVKDKYGKNYIFQENVVMDYKVILDTYTVNVSKFAKEYNEADEKTKVLMNIEKFFEAINDKDYKYAYSKLDETFKSTNFKTQQEFENYIKQNFFEQNKVSAGKPEVEGDTYLYDITITNNSGENEDSITKKFVMQLKEGTDFVMSFSVT